MNSLGLLLKRLARSETASLSIWVVLISLAAIAAAGLYYTWRLPETVVQEETRLIYTQRGVFDYTAYLKPNTVYGGVMELEPRPSFFAVLVESLQMTYAYDLSLSDPSGELLPIPQESMVEYEVAAILREGTLWSREQILIPRRPAIGADIELDFNLPIQAYQAEAETIRAEVSTPGREVEVEVQVRVWPAVPTASGLIQPAFVHGFAFRWQDSELLAGGSPVHEESATLGESTVVPHPQRALISDISTGGLWASSLLILLWTVVSQWALRSPFSAQQMALELHRRYGDVIVEALTLPASAPHQIVVHLRSLEDIGRTAHELMKPIILVDHEDERHYVVIDGADNVRYEVRISRSTGRTLSRELPTRDLSTLEENDGPPPFLHRTFSASTASLVPVQPQVNEPLHPQGGRQSEDRTAAGP